MHDFAQLFAAKRQETRRGTSMPPAFYGGTFHHETQAAENDETCVGSRVRFGVRRGRVRAVVGSR
jgi:hypothetical protein